MSYLHKSVAVFHEGALGDLFEAVADVGKVPRLQDEGLVVMDQGQRHAEQDLGPFVEQAVPDPQNSLK